MSGRNPLTNPPAASTIAATMPKAAAPQRRWPLKRIVYFCLSLAVTVGVFSYLARHITPGQVLDVIRGMARRWLGMFFVLSLVMSVLRTWRYRLALMASGFAPPRLALFLVVIVRNFFSDLLPARLGTLVYVYIVTTRLGVPFGAAMSSFALSFLFDIIALAPMIAVAAAAAGALTDQPSGVLLGGGVVLGGATVAVLYALPWLFHVGTLTLRWTSNRTGHHLDRWVRAWQHAEEEIRRARRAGIYARLLVLSLLVRLTKYGALMALLVALLVPLGYVPAELSPARMFIGLCSAEFVVSLPVSGIAGFGAYEGTWTVVFQLLGFPADVAQLTSVSHHVLTQVYGYGLGILALLVLLLPAFRRDPQAPSDTVRPGPAGPFYLKVLLTVAVTAGLLASLWMVPYR
jgi:uncharacterized membrane protein YbhN (UPF0104 family)